MGKEISPSLRCPKCGSGNILGYQGVWECMDCGYKFRSVGSYSNEHKRRPSSNTGKGKWIAALIAMFLLGLYFGYALSTLQSLFATITLTSSASITQTLSYSSYINPSTSNEIIREISPPPGYFKAFEVEIFRIAFKSIWETYGKEGSPTLYPTSYGYKYVIVNGTLKNIGSRKVYFGGILTGVYLKSDSGKIYEGHVYTVKDGYYIPDWSIDFPMQEPGEEIPLIIIFKNVIDTEHPKELIFQFLIREQRLEYHVYLT